MSGVDNSNPFNINLLPHQKAIVTDVIGEGACFLHAFLHGISPRQYSSMPRDERKRYVATLRKKLASSLTFKKFIAEMPNVILNFAQYELKAIINAVFKFLETGVAVDLDAEIVDELVSKLDFYKRVFEKFSRKINYDIILNIRDFKVGAIADKIVQNYGSIEIDDIAILIEKIFVERSLEKYKVHLGTYSEQISDYSFKYIGDTLRTLVIFINDDGSLYKYALTKGDIINYDKAIIINYTTSHFRSIAIEKGDQNLRLFDIADPLIKPLVDALF